MQTIWCVHLTHLAGDVTPLKVHDSTLQFCANEALLLCTVTSQVSSMGSRPCCTWHLLLVTSYHCCTAVLATT